MASEDKPDDAADDGMADWAEALLEQKATEPTGAEGQPGGVLSGAAPRPFSSSSGGGDAPINDINMVLDIPVQLSVELGRTKVPIKHILQLGQGSVVELDALAGEPMDVLVNGYLIAQGEVVVVNDKFGIRLTDVVTPSERLRRISKN
jgi:flagellar motor switch protein FliN/FliY